MYYWAVSDNGSTGPLQGLGGSSILPRSTKFYAGLAQLVERVLAKHKVVSSNLISRSS